MGHNHRQEAQRWQVSLNLHAQSQAKSLEPLAPLRRQALAAA